MVQGFFWVVGRSRDVFGFPFLSPFDHPCHLKSGVPPPPPPWEWERVSESRTVGSSCEV